MPDELINKVKDWLQKNGYPLEMRVAKTLRQSDVKVSQGEYYLDRKTEKYREIDIRAELSIEKHALDVGLTLCIECKSSKEKPWVVFTNEMKNSSVGYLFVQQVKTEVGKKFIGLAMKPKFTQLLIQETGSLPLYSMPERVGYGVSTALRAQDGGDTAYEAVFGVISAASALAEDITKRSTPRSKKCFFIFPLIITKAPIYEAYLNESSQVEVSQVEEALLMLRGGMTSTYYTPVWLSSEENLPNIIERMKETWNILTSDKFEEAFKTLSDQQDT